MLRLDRAAIATLTELDPTGRSGLVGRVLTTFVDSVAELRPTFEASWQAGDLESLRLVSHTLKSSAAIVGAGVLSRVCGAIEDAVRVGDTPALPTLVARFAPAMDDALVAIRVELGTAP